jgi:membrane-bound ClpP family serine protease
MFIDWLLVLVIGLFITGFILVGIEMITPGLHAPGIFGAASLVVAIFLISDTFVEGAIITIIVLVVLAIMLAVILSLLSRGKLKSPIILKEEQSNKEGYISANDLKHLMGKQGVALTDLRPSGVGSFDGSNQDVISEGKYIIKGAKIIVFKVQGSKLIVKEVD